jgi:hypothetical protein
MTPEKCQCANPGLCKLLRRECDPPDGRRMSKARHRECQTAVYFEMFLGETRLPCNGVEPHKTPESDWNQSPCIHLGEEVETRFCTTCGGMNGKPYAVRECAIHGVCSERKRDSRVECCLGCFEYATASTPTETHPQRPS